MEQKLKKKYTKQRKINEKYIKKKTPTQKVFSFILSFICTVICVVAVTIGVSIVVSKIKRTAPSVAGYTTMVIATGSMVASGFNKQDKIISKTVNTDSLKVGDKIVFYQYDESDKYFSYSKVRKVSESEIVERKSSVTLPEFFGFMNEEKVEAAQAGSHLIFHHIYAIYEDANGVRWFDTKGSSNVNRDPWHIREEYILGIYDDSKIAGAVISVIDLLSSPMMLVLCLMAPFCFVAWIIVLLCLKEVQYAKLEYDIVEEKRKLDDDVCLEYNIGFRMSEDTKYKVLALAPEDKKLYYITLLWEDANERHNSLKKYYLRKQLQLRPNVKLRDLNRECEEMFHNGIKPTTIASYYLRNKKEIEKEKLEAKKKLKTIRNQYKHLKIEEKQEKASN